MATPLGTFLRVDPFSYVCNFFLLFQIFASFIIIIIIIILFCYLFIYFYACISIFVCMDALYLV